MGWLFLDSRRSLWTKEREGPQSVEDGLVPSSSLGAGSESGGPIMGPMEKGLPVLASGGACSGSFSVLYSGSFSICNKLYLLRNY